MALQRKVSGFRCPQAMEIVWLEEKQPSVAVQKGTFSHTRRAVNKALKSKPLDLRKKVVQNSRHEHWLCAGLD